MFGPARCHLMRGYFPNGKHVWPCGLAPSLLVKLRHPPITSSSARPYQPGSLLPIRTGKLAGSSRGPGVVMRLGENTRGGPVLRFFCIYFFSRFSFLFLKPYASRFSLCSPSFYVPHSLSHRHFMCVSMRRNRSLRAGPGGIFGQMGRRGDNTPEVMVRPGFECL